MSTLIPRKYQEEIFEQARYENVIAALDTGSGKTLIAVLIIRWIASRLTGDHKICAFIVPRVPLVEQQTIFLSSQLPLTVRGYYGALVDPWQHDPGKWKKEFEECDVMVMTPQVFLDAMLHAHWSMTQVALLVFDEAHHTRKNNPYNQIMREFYHTLPPRYRPKVFGMTASPIWNINNPLQSLKDLEFNMLSKVIGVRQNLDELAENSPRPNETIVQYAATASYPTYTNTLWQKLGDHGLHDNPNFVADKIETRYMVTLYELGPFAADIYLATYLNTILSHYTSINLHSGLMELEYMSSFSTVTYKGLSSESPTESPTESLQIARDVLTIKKLLDEFVCHGFKEESFEVPNEWLSPKLRMLVSELCARRHNSFQGMIFVEQRQIAVTLAWILSKISELKSWIFPGAIVGHGTARLNSTQGMIDKKQKQTINFFRTGVYNMLVSTSVGEEGLDFQACDLVVRFNELQHLVGYLQSRGRARRFDSTYLVMVPVDDYRNTGRSRYERLKVAEPSIRDLYQRRHMQRALLQSDGEEEEEDPVDIAIREQFIIPATGAVLTFGSAVSLLNHLCALIPRDGFTKAIQPIYKGEFQVTVTLPSALPIPRDKLTYQGGLRNTKREAKAAAAFVACKALFDPLNVFDQHFLPVRKTSGYEVKDADDRLIPDLERIDQLMDVLVYDPWLPWNIQDNQTMFTAWIHPLVFPGQDHAVMALVTAGPLTMPLPDMPINDGRLYFTTSGSVNLPFSAWQILHDFTALGIKWCNTSKTFDQLTCFLIPLDPHGLPDFEKMQDTIQNPLNKGTAIKHTDEGYLLLQVRYRQGSPLLLRELREDLTPLSEPTLKDSNELVGRFSTYLEYFESIYASRRYTVFIPREGPLLRVEKFTRHFSSEYQHPASKSKFKIGIEQPPKKLTWVPMAACDVFAFSRAQIEAFVVFPQIIRRITDVYRAREAIKNLGLPCINEDLAVEALTLPSTNLSFNNQRLETLGDSVLKICVVTYVFNRFPYRHEGQLDCLRKNSVSNRALVAWANKIRLERFLSCEPSSVKKWRPTIEGGSFQDGQWNVERKFGRRGLQDCMESLLGASFLSGGLSASLKMGVALQLCFGGSEPWNIRYSSRPTDPVPSLFNSLQIALGYQFQSGRLLCEAFTHPSSASETPSYQRLEFLGDGMWLLSCNGGKSPCADDISTALVDLVVLEYLYNKFPQATSGQLTWAKSRAVWAPALTTLAVRRLSLQKYLLRSNVDLERAITKAVSDHEDMDYFHVVVEGWRYDPPKALSDVMESLCGAMFVDSQYDYDRVKPIILQIMDPLLQVLQPKLPRDPTSELYIFMAKRGCQKAKFEKFCSQGLDSTTKHNNSLRFKVHDIAVGEPFHAGNRGLNKVKPLLAHNILGQLEKDFSVADICDCRLNKVPLKIEDIIDRDDDELDDEKEDEFAIRAARELHNAEESISLQIHATSEDDTDEIDEHEVEDLIDTMEL